MKRPTPSWGRLGAEYQILDPDGVEPIGPTGRFLEAARAYGIAFDEGDCERLGLYLALLLHVNTRFNLTSVRDADEAWMRHVFDSLTLLPIVERLGGTGLLTCGYARHNSESCATTVIDVGSGGGLPGVVLAIVRPGLSVTLLEATGKKADFLRLCAQHLALRNIDIVQARAEAAGAHGTGAHRDRYDLVCARALGPLRVAAELCVPLARVGGYVAMTKGERADAELAEAADALRLLEAEHAGTIQTPTGRIVVLHKTAPTPRTYPRRDGEPKRAPLGGGT